ncbi:hypothetical protein Dimus_007519, partial [Dionaea muscipula]
QQQREGDGSGFQLETGRRKGGSGQHLWDWSASVPSSSSRGVFVAASRQAVLSSSSSFG